MVASVNDRKISKGSTVDHSEVGNITTNSADSFSSRTLSHRRSRIGSKILKLHNLSNDVENEVCEEEIGETIMPVEPRCLVVSLNVVLPKDELLTVNVDTFPNMSIRDLLVEGLYKLNRSLEDKHYGFRFDFKILDLFNIKPSKKNGYPKDDFPILDKKSDIIGTGFSSLSLIYDSKDLIQLKKPIKCINCQIF
jgi:hypothetical protein